MRVGNFSVLIPQGQETDSGHIRLPHGTVYTMRLVNHWHNRDCDADVTIDGKAIASFRIYANEAITIEHPPHDHGRFTFYEADSNDGRQAGAASVSTDNRGLVQVHFRPGKPKQQSMSCSYPPRAAGRVRGQSATPQWTDDATVQLKGLSSEKPGGLTVGSSCSTRPGVTGLSGQSGQTFVSAPDIDYEPGLEVVISVRLVASQAGPRPLTPAPATQSNPVPGPVV